MLPYPYCHVYFAFVSQTYALCDFRDFEQCMFILRQNPSPFHLLNGLRAKLAVDRGLKFGL